MKISSKLPQFGNETVLLIVASQLGAAFYFISRGVLAKIDYFELKKPEYSDHEGKFIRRGRGKIFASGAAYEFDKRGMTREFLRELEKRTKTIMAKYKITSSYIFAPTHLMEQVKAVLAEHLRGNYVMSFRGNYYSQHPFELLEKIGERRKRRVVRRRVMPTKSEAAKILRRT